MFVDEEGRLKGLPVNMVVTRGRRVIDEIAGNVVFVGFDGSKSVPLNDKQVEVVRNVLRYKIKDIFYNEYIAIEYM